MQRNPALTYKIDKAMARSQSGPTSVQPVLPQFIMKTYLKLGALVALTFIFLAVPVRQTVAKDDDQYSFNVHNTTDAKITKLLASEDGKEYGSFDIGSGIAREKR